MENMLNNRIVRLAICAAIGGTIGYFVGGFVVNKLYSSEYEEIQVFDESTTEDPKAVEINKTLEKFSVITPSQTARPKAVIRDYSRRKAREEKGELKKLAARYREEPEVVEDEPTLSGDPDGETPVDPDAIHVISEQEYNERPEVKAPYSKTILHYFDDDVVTDESDEPISRVERIIGEDALNSFGEGTTDPDLVFVMNPLTGAMYQIIRMHKEYNAVVAKPRRRPVRKVTKAPEDDES